MSYSTANSQTATGRRAIISAAKFSPTSNRDRLIFPLNMTSKQYITTSFSTQWAEGRISLQEIKQVLNSLRNTKAFNSFGVSPYIGSSFLFLGSFCSFSLPSSCR